MRQLKYHEKKLLRKVDLYSWKNEDNLRVGKIVRMYGLKDRTEYDVYNRLVGSITKTANRIKQLPDSDAFRISITEQLLEKLYNLGVVDSTSSLRKADTVNVSQFCRRRLAVVAVRLKMAERISVATTLIEQGQLRVGTHVVTDPAYLVSRNLEDYVTWVDSSKMKRTIQKYNNKLDDYDLL